jgi:hypothetical protein
LAYHKAGASAPTNNIDEIQSNGAVYKTTRRCRRASDPRIPAGANLDLGDPEMLLFSMTRFFRFLPEEQRKAFLEGLSEKAS